MDRGFLLGWSVLEIDDGKGCTTVNIQKAAESYPFKWVSFIICELYLNYKTLEKKNSVKGQPLLGLPRSGVCQSPSVLEMLVTWFSPAGTVSWRWEREARSMCLHHLACCRCSLNAC